MARICELCKTENDDDSQFCDKCGNPLVEIKEVTDEEEEVQAAKKSKPLDWKMLAIPIVILVVLAGVWFYLNTQAKNQQLAAKQAVQNYLDAIKAGKYSEALKNATGTGLSPEYEKAFQDFMVQIIPPMPINEELDKAMANLVTISDGIEAYYHTNGKFPGDIKELAPVTIPSIPEIPGGGEYGYETDKNAENYTVFVKGKRFEAAGLPENFPAYSRTNNLQAPGRKIVYGQWKILNYEILDVQTASKTEARVKVRETCQFGPTTKVEEDFYFVVFKDGKWMIDVNASSPLEIVSLTNAFTQMKDLGEPPAPPEPSPLPPGATPPPPPPSKKTTEMKLPLGMVLLSFSKIAADPANLEGRIKRQYRQCLKSLDDLAAGLTGYARQHDGKYPDQLLWIYPKYCKTMPIDTASGQDIFSGGYQTSAEKDAYTIAVQGGYYKVLGIEEGFPQYSSKLKMIIEKAEQLPATAPEVSGTPEATGTPEAVESPEATPSPGASGETPGASPTTPTPEGTPGATAPGKAPEPKSTDVKAGEKPNPTEKKGEPEEKATTGEKAPATQPKTEKKPEEKTK